MATTATRRWWRRHDGGDDDPDDLVPMDTQEQEELVRSLEAKQAQQSRRWRVRFRFPIPSAWRYGRRDLPWAQGSGLCLDLAISCSHHLLFCAARLRGVPPRLRGLPCLLQFPPRLVSLGADWIAALACLFAVKGLLQNSGPSKKWMWYSCYIGILVAMFWTYYILRLPRIRWDVAWLPLGPLMAGALSLYVDHVLLESMQDISTLRSYMYNFKAL